MRKLNKTILNNQWSMRKLQGKLKIVRDKLKQNCKV